MARGFVELRTVARFAGSHHGARLPTGSRTHPVALSRHPCGIGCAANRLALVRRLIRGLSYREALA